jgi:demethylmenaquinone methyltransferase/2-methoxy-6-polyprenyl-1,4-benzoquinol methylase
MRQPNETVVEGDQQKLGPPTHVDDAASFEAAAERVRQREAQIGAARLHAHEAPPCQHWFEAAPHGFDFGKFRHGGKVARSPRFRYGRATMSPTSPRPSREEAETHFGYRTVAESEKAPLVKSVFERVARRYDLMNDLMSGGVHRLWKAAMIDWLNPQPSMRLVDVGGGTGDIALRFLDGGGGSVVVVDINEEMLTVGRDRAIDRGRLAEIAWLCGDAERLPIADASVDAYTTAFCLRNVTRIPAALREARRVLKPGGHFLCLEFSRVALPVLDRLYDAYSFTVLPALGRVVAGDTDAYRYLAESIRRFPAQQPFARMIAESGLQRVRYRSLSGGIAAIHSAWRI